VPDVINLWTRVRCHQCLGRFWRAPFSGRQSRVRGDPPSGAKASVNPRLRQSDRLCVLDGKPSEVRFGSFATVSAGIVGWLMSASARKRRTKTGLGALRSASHEEGRVGQHLAEKQSKRSDLLQPASLARSQLGRAVLQQDQTMSSGGDPLRQARRQLPCLPSTRVNQALAVMSPRPIRETATAGGQ